MGHAVSSDNGKTWQPSPDVPVGSGLLLANGDRLRSVALRSRAMADLPLPAPLATRQGTYGSTYNIYALEDLPAELRAGWRFARCRAGQSAWIEETATVHMPGEIRYVAVEPTHASRLTREAPPLSEGVFTFPWMWRMRLAPDGSIWGMYYAFRAPNRRLNERWAALLLRSTDNGHTWSLQSEILYQGDPAADAGWDKWDGFGEPNVAFLPDGSLLCFLRTTDGHGIGPLYLCCSQDNGATWDMPRVFDDRGVWPAVVELKSGVTLVSYGRTGLFVRATADPAGHAWGERVAVVEPKAYQTDTCSYSDLIALDDQTALIAYADFQYPDANGEKRKTILVRTVSVT